MKEGGGLIMVRAGGGGGDGRHAAEQARDGRNADDRHHPGEGAALLIRI